MNRRAWNRRTWNRHIARQKRMQRAAQHFVAGEHDWWKGELYSAQRREAVTLVANVLTTLQPWRMP